MSFPALTGDSTEGNHGGYSGINLRLKGIWQENPMHCGDRREEMDNAGYYVVGVCGQL